MYGTILVIRIRFFRAKMSRDRVKTKVDRSGEVKAASIKLILHYLASRKVKAFSQTAISNNQAVVEYCRTSMAALSGGTAGILGLSTLYGFAFYGISVVALWLLVLWKVGN